MSTYPVPSVSNDVKISSASSGVHSILMSCSASMNPLRDNFSPLPAKRRKDLNGKGYGKFFDKIKSTFNQITFPSCKYRMHRETDTIIEYGP